MQDQKVILKIKQFKLNHHNSQSDKNIKLYRFPAKSQTYNRLQKHCHQKYKQICQTNQIDPTFKLNFNKQLPKHQQLIDLVQDINSCSIEQCQIQARTWQFNNSMYFKNRFGNKKEKKNQIMGRLNRDLKQVDVLFEDQNGDHDSWQQQQWMPVNQMLGRYLSRPQTATQQQQQTRVSRPQSVKIVVSRKFGAKYSEYTDKLQHHKYQNDQQYYQQLDQRYQQWIEQEQQQVDDRYQLDDKIGCDNYDNISNYNSDDNLSNLKDNPFNQYVIEGIQKKYISNRSGLLKKMKKGQPLVSQLLDWKNIRKVEDLKKDLNYFTKQYNQKYR